MLDYYNQGRSRILIHEETDRLILHLLQYLADNGLDATIAYIVAHKKSGFKFDI